MTGEKVHGVSIDETDISRPIIGLVKDLKPHQLEGVVIDAILRHRFLRDEATALFDRLGAADKSRASSDEIDFAERAYLAAMIAMHAHQTSLSTLLDVLGYIPQVPEPKPSN